MESGTAGGGGDAGGARATAAGRAQATAEGRARATAEGRRAVSVSLGAGVVQMAVKVVAFAATGSAAVFADAAESAVHLLAVFFAFLSLNIASKPPDRDHPYGHAKIGFFSAGVEGGVILVAALYIIGDAVARILSGPELNQIGVGIALTAATVALNGLLGFWLIRTGKRHGLIIVSSNGWHVLTDAWTSVGVIVGLVLAAVTGWAYWDPICALVVAGNIIFTGVALVRRAVVGLMDTAEPSDLAKVEAIISGELAGSGVTHHAVRMRGLGYGLSVDFHLVFDDDISIREAHELATRIEREVAAAFDPPASVMSHLEPKLDHDRLHGPPAPPPGG